MRSRSADTLLWTGVQDVVFKWLVLWTGIVESGLQVVGAMNRVFRISFSNGWCCRQGVSNLVLKWLVLWTGSLESGFQVVSAMDREFSIRFSSGWCYG